MLFSAAGRVDCVSRVSARRSGLLEPLTWVRVCLRWGRGLPTLQEVALDRVFPGVLRDFDRLHWAGYLLHLWLEAFPGVTESNDPYRLLRLSLESLEAGLEPLILVSWAEVQVLRLLGTPPQVRKCLRCGAEPGWFSVEAGGALCSSCRVSGVAVSSEVLGWLAFLQGATLVKLAGASPPAEVVGRGRELLKGFLLYSFPRLERFLA